MPPETNWCDAVIRGRMARYVQKSETLCLILRSNSALEIYVSKNAGKTHWKYQIAKKGEKKWKKEL